jgi:hypothetical protein
MTTHHSPALSSATKAGRENPYICENLAPKRGMLPCPFLIQHKNDSQRSIQLDVPKLQNSSA